MDTYTDMFIKKCRILPSKSNIRNISPVLNPHDSPEDKFAHLQLMFELKQYDELLLLIEQLVSDDKDEITRLPFFSLASQLLIAEARLRSGHGPEAFSRLLQLREDTSPPLEASSSLWRWRIDLSVINAAVRLRLWDFVVDELLSLHHTIAARIETYSNRSPEAELILADVVILCRLCRVYLQVSDAFFFPVGINFSSL